MVATMPVPGRGMLPRRDVHLMAAMLGFVLGGNLDQYRMARTLPAAVVYIVRKALPLQPRIWSAVVLSRLMNVALLVLAAISWGRLARQFSFDHLAAWIGL